MKRVRKSLQPPQVILDYFTQYSKAPAQLTWVKFKNNNARRDAVRNQLRMDQRGLCAYCEIRLILSDESVEHFMPKFAGMQYELAWDNLLLCCCGGEERPLPEDVEDAAFRYDPQSDPTCGRAKLNDMTPIFHPLNLPAFPRIFRFSSERGEIFPDDAACIAQGIDPGLAETTIDKLGLRSGRLNRARLAVSTALLEMLEDGGGSEAFTPELEHEIAIQQIPSTGDLPAFFTTIRWTLGEGGETYLKSIGFNG